jgi:hypothetical protein
MDLCSHNIRLMQCVIYIPHIYISKCECLFTSGQLLYFLYILLFWLAVLLLHSAFNSTVAYVTNDETELPKGVLGLKLQDTDVTGVSILCLTSATK